MGEIDRRSMRAQAVSAFEKGVEAADPGDSTGKALSQYFDPAQVEGDLNLLAIGKAALGMAQAAQDALSPAKIKHVLAVTNYENATESEGIEVLAAGHPVPDENGAKAALRVEDMLQQAKVGDVIIALVSGGSSALLPAPIQGLTLADKIKVNEILLGSGLDIGSMNIVRQALSRTKGGKLLSQALPARMISFVLSDVLGDDMRLVGSGPTIGPVGGPKEARRILQTEGLWESLPSAVRDALTHAETSADLPDPEAHLIGSNSLSLKNMADALSAHISARALEGDVQAAAERVVREALTLKPGEALAFGGETTVILKGSGLGGRNQELALRVAQEAARQKLPGAWVFLSGGTDGRDGPTDAAGGLVDDQTLARLAALDVSLTDHLDNNDSYAALKAAGDLLMTGATGTNVADLQIFMRAG